MFSRLKFRCVQFAGIRFESCSFGDQRNLSFDEILKRSNVILFAFSIVSKIHRKRDSVNHQTNMIRIKFLQLSLINVGPGAVYQCHIERKTERQTRDLNFTASYVEIDASSETEFGPV